MLFGRKLKCQRHGECNVARKYTVCSYNLLLVGHLNIELYNGWGVLNIWEIGKFQRDVGVNERIMYIT